MSRQSTLSLRAVKAKRLYHQLLTLRFGCLPGSVNPSLVQQHAARAASQPAVRCPLCRGQLTAVQAHGGPVWQCGCR